MTNDGFKQTLGNYLRSKRKARGLTIEALAVQSGVHRTTLSRWERGKNVPFAHELTSVLGALQVSHKDRQVFYRTIEAPRALHIADAGETTALPVSSGELLRALRNRAQVSQRTVARAANVAQSLVVKWEKGECWPSSQQLHAFCFAIGATTDEMVFLTTRAWRHIEPLPSDKDALDAVVLNLEYHDATTTRAGTYLALAARYHDLYRTGKISEAEATSVYGSYGYYLAWCLDRYNDAAKVAAPVFEVLRRSRGTLTMGQMEAITLQVLHGDEMGTRGFDAPVKPNAKRHLQKNLALLSATSSRWSLRYQSLHDNVIAVAWENAGNIEAATPYYERGIAAAQTEKEATHRRDIFVETLCRHGKFRQAAPLLRPMPSSETRPIIQSSNLLNHAEVFAGLGNFAKAEQYYAHAVHVVQTDLVTHSSENIQGRRIVRAIEKGRRR